MQAPRPLDDYTDHRIERVLAEARVFVSVASLLAIYLDPTQPGPDAARAYQLLVGYASLSIALLLTIDLRPPAATWLPLVMHATDVAWLVALSTQTASDSPLFGFFTFVLLAATYRWGARETLITLAVVSAALLIHTFALGASNGLLQRPFSLGGFVAGTAYLVITGVVLAHLAAEERQLRLEGAAAAEILAAVRSETRLRAAFDRILQVLADAFSARQVSIVLRQTTTGAAHVWQLAGPSDARQVTSDELTSDQAAAFFQPAPETFLLVRDRRGVRYDGLIDVDDRFRRGTDEGEPIDVPGFESWERILVAGTSVTSGSEEWTARVLIAEPSFRRRENALRLVKRLIGQVAPALRSRYRVGRIRSKASALERARLAHDLHDSSIQALIGLEMHLMALSRRAYDPGIRDELFQIQTRLRIEIRELRTLMEQLHPPEQGPENIGQYLTALADRFKEETRIRARITCAPGLAVSPEVGYELARIVQAALSNVRRHSGASRVEVTLQRRDDAFALDIEDDGAGIEVQHRLFRAAPVAQAPRTIRERVHRAGGELVVRALPSGGTRLEILIPSTPVSA